MSRSYKKTPWCGDKKGKAKKRIANHTVRRHLKNNMDLMLSPGDYKKLYESWDICDFYGIVSWEEHWNRAWERYYWRCSMFPNKEHPVPNKEKEYIQWRKWYCNK